MTAAGEGIGRLVPFLLVSLLLHLAAIVAVVAVDHRAPVDREATYRMTVEYLGTAEMEGGLPEKEARQTVPSVTAKSASPLAAKDGTGFAPRSKRGEAQVDGYGPKRPMEKLPSTPALSVSPAQPNVRRDALPSAPAPPGATMIDIGTVGGSGGTPNSAGTGDGAAVRSAGGGSGGSGGSGTLSAAAAARRGAYEALLKCLIEEHKEYPRAARRTRQEGTCLRRFTLGRNGSLKRVDPLSSCGHAFLDDAASRAITAVGTFPPLPEDFKGTEATFTVSIKFTLQ